MMTNPLLQPWNTPFELPPFEHLNDEDFGPAMEAAMAEGHAAVQAIASNSEPPSFANTIDALESAHEALDRTGRVFYTLASTDANPTREALERELAPKLSAYASSITRNALLFARIEKLWAQRDTLDLNEEQSRVLLLTRRDFLRVGAALEGEDADRLAAIKQRLSVLGTAFRQNLLADERHWALDLDDEQLSTLPDFVQNDARAAGAARDRPGAVLTLARSLVVPFLAFHPDRALRRRVFEAWCARGANGGDTDNRAIVAEMLALRAEQAKLLGYDDYASYKLEPEMAKNPDAVRDLLLRVWKPARQAALTDQAALQALAHADGITDSLAPWDWRFYAERRRQQLHALDESAVKPYFRLERMIEAAFACAQRLFGLEFQPLDLPLHHPDARAWEVTRDGQHQALFIGDYFARPSKQSGAWCSALRTQQALSDSVRPIVLNVCNFSKGDPSLLSHDDARTLFHEFGHALHQMLSDVTYPSISGLSVARDFVELPSQLFEHWLDLPEVLAEFATNTEGEAIPEELSTRLLAATHYDMGFQSVEYLASAFVDLAFHEGAPPVDPMQKQAEVLESLGMPAAIAMRHATPHFAHVFTGDGYAAGYYSYLWSEVMDADAFAAFEEVGDPFDAAIAERLDTQLLSRGGSVDAETLYRRFRGRLPGVEALLRGRGLDTVGA